MSTSRPRRSLSRTFSSRWLRRVKSGAVLPVVSMPATLLADRFTPAVAEEAALRATVCVVVGWDGAHVVVDVELEAVVLGNHGGEAVDQLRVDLRRWRRGVLLPHHHRHPALLALGDPAQLVLEEPVR